MDIWKFLQLDQENFLHKKTFDKWKSIYILNGLPKNWCCFSGHIFWKKVSLIKFHRIGDLIWKCWLSIEKRKQSHRNFSPNQFEMRRSDIKRKCESAFQNSFDPDSNIVPHKHPSSYHNQLCFYYKNTSEPVSFTIHIKFTNE